MPKKTPASPRKAPMQVRSKAMVDLILLGATRVLTKEGYAAFTTNRVAEVAGISIGSLYQYFPNKEALLIEITRQHVNELHISLSETLDDSESLHLDVVIQRVIKGHIALHLIAPELHRVLSEEVPKQGNLDWQSQLMDDISLRIMNIVKQRDETSNIIDLELLIFVLVNTVESVVHQALFKKQMDLESGAIERLLIVLVSSTLISAPRYSFDKEDP